LRFLRHRSMRPDKGGLQPRMQAQKRRLPAPFGPRMSGRSRRNRKMDPVQHRHATAATASSETRASHVRQGSGPRAMRRPFASARVIGARRFAGDEHDVDTPITCVFQYACRRSAGIWVISGPVPNEENVDLARQRQQAAALVVKAGPRRHAGGSCDPPGPLKHLATDTKEAGAH